VRRQVDVIRASAWLGWQIDANWADPFTFLVYSIAKPLATSLILYFMVRIVSPASATGDTFLFLFLGNTFFLYVTEVLIGISWTVFRDREDYETLKYIYLAPMPLRSYLFGRGLSKMATATLGVVVALLFGRFVLHLSIGTASTPWGLVLVAVLLGLVSVAWLGIILAGISLVVARHSINLNEGLSGVFYLLSGAVFPIEVLPRFAQRISLWLPFTYWLELLRRLIVGRSFSTTLRRLSDGELWGILALSTVAIAVVAWLWFRQCEHIARSRGLIDWKTNY
jgi:ABC-2 type transport system permease protein